MSWTAPPVSRRDNTENLLGDERAILEFRLEWQRATLLLKCAGLTAEQLASRAVPPANLSLLGLLRHMSQVERTWFTRGMAGREDLARVYPTGGTDVELAVAASAEQDYATFLSETAESRRIAGRFGLDDEFTVVMWEGCQANVRWSIVHMIEEYSRHNGHADLLRECIDGARGL